MVKIDFKELQDDRKRNRKDRLDFVTMYARWVRRTPNRVWSKQQKRMIDDIITSANKAVSEGVNVS